MNGQRNTPTRLRTSNNTTQPPPQTTRQIYTRSARTDGGTGARPRRRTPPSPRQRLRKNADALPILVRKPCAAVEQRKQKQKRHTKAGKPTNQLRRLGTAKREVNRNGGSPLPTRIRGAVGGLPLRRPQSLPHTPPKPKKRGNGGRRRHIRRRRNTEANKKMSKRRLEELFLKNLPYCDDAREAWTLARLDYEEEKNMWRNKK